MKPSTPSFGKQVVELLVVVAVFFTWVVLVVLAKGAMPDVGALLIPVPFMGTWAIHRGLKNRFFR